MGYQDALKDGIRVSGVWQERFYHPRCRLCGDEMNSFNYKSDVKYTCKSCKEIIAADEKDKKKAESYEPSEKKLAEAVKRIKKQGKVSEYGDAILKVADEMHSGSAYDSTEEIMTAIELSKIGIPYRSQVKLGAYRADFILDGLKVVLEVDGVLYHTQKTQGREELRDGLILLALGAEWQVIRITDELINMNITRLMPAIEKVVKKRNMLRQADGSLPKWYTDRKTS